jgi:hypothetical protein
LFGADDSGEAMQEFCIDEELLQSMAMEMEQELERDLDEGPEEELTEDIDGHNVNLLDDVESVISEEE